MAAAADPAASAGAEAPPHRLAPAPAAPLRALLVCALALGPALLPGGRALHRWRLSAAALEAVADPDTPSAALRARLTPLAALEPPPAFLPALEVAAAVRDQEADPAARAAQLAEAAARLEAADLPLGRSLKRYRADPGQDRSQEDPESPSDTFSLVFDGWRLAHARAVEPLGRLLDRIPVSFRGDFHVRYLRVIHRALRAPREVDALLEGLEATYDALHRDPAAPDLGFGPDAFDPVLVADVDGSVVLRPAPWRGDLVGPRTSRLNRRADLHLSIASLAALTGDVNRSLFHAQILEKSYMREVADRDLTAPLERLLVPRPFRAAARAAARAHQVDEMLLYALAREESHFKPDAVSPVGARGLCQVMPKTAEWIAQQTQQPKPGLQDLLEPERNLELGAWYLNYLGGKFWNKETRWKWALASYNAGLGPATRWLKDWKAKRKQQPDLEPEDVIDYPETQDYVKKVYKSWQRYREVYGDEGGAGS